MTDEDVAVLERPMYSVIEAARMLGLQSPKVRAWLDGYQRGGHWYEPVVRPEHTGGDVVTWGEFVELGYLREYRRANVPLQRLRPAIVELRDVYQTPYPLALNKLFVSGRELVLDLQDRLGLPRSLFMVARTKQTIMLTDPANRFFRKVEFHPDAGVVRRFLPAGATSPVVIDPLRRYGRPSVEGVSTERLWELYDAGEQINEIADAYELEPDTVGAAIAYEQQFQSLAA
jgi:uncharacterized protein (DUF433 family)